MYKKLTDAWEQRKLGNQFDTLCAEEGFSKSKHPENGEIPFYKIGTFGGRQMLLLYRRAF